MSDLIYEELWVQNKRLKEFARYVIETECWSIFEIDGGSVQDLAEKLGLIEPHVVTDADADSDFGPGDTIYKFAGWLKKQKK